MLDLAMFAAEAAGAVAEHAEEPTALFLTPGGWVAASMLFVFGIMLYAKVPAIIAAALDKQIAGIKDQIDAAERLRIEAESLKGEYEKKIKNASKEAVVLKAAAEEEAKLIVAKAKEDATALIARRTKSAEQKIEAAERAAIADVRAKAAEAATAAAARLIAANHDAKVDKDLVDTTIARLN